MTCSNCGLQTHGGYCDCMIIDGEFVGAWWKDVGKEQNTQCSKINKKSQVLNTQQNHDDFRRRHY